jgi:hypothetical protein
VLTAFAGNQLVAVKLVALDVAEIAARVSGLDGKLGKARVPTTQFLPADFHERSS